ncbi:MAG: glycosyltransferase family 2 protein [Anaerolineae bacterium]
MAINPDLPPKVTVVIPNWNTQRWLPGCLDGLRAQTYHDFKVLLVDNGSTDGSLELVRTRYPEVEILAFPENRGFAPAVNAGIRQSDSEYIALLNVDTIPQPDWLACLVETMEQNLPDVGSLAAKMLSMDDPAIMDDAGNTLSWYGSACKRGRGEPAQNYVQMEEVLSACGGAAFYRRDFLEAVGLFDETFVSYLEDVDLGLQGRLRGYRCLYVPGAQVLHQWRGAGIPRPRYVYLATRNRLTLLLKNMPWSLLLKHSPTLLYGQFYFFLVYKKPLASLAGIFAFLQALPRILKQRRMIQQGKSISNHALEALLTHDLGEPPLSEIILNKLRRN